MLKVLVNRYRRRESLHGRFMVALDREGRCGYVSPSLGNRVWSSRRR